MALRATRTWTGEINSNVAPIPQDWEEAKVESRRRIKATEVSKFEITGRLIARAYDALVNWFPECGDEINQMAPEKIVEMYLEL